MVMITGEREDQNEAIREVTEDTEAAERKSHGFLGLRVASRINSLGL